MSPTYDYYCEVCGNWEHDVVRKIEDRDKPVFCDWEQCPGHDTCRYPVAAKMTRKISAPAIKPDSSWNQ